MKVVTKQQIVTELKRIGLSAGDTVMVHTSLKQMGYVCGGAQSVIEALIETVGPEGNLMMPTQSWKNLDPETGVHWDADECDWPVIRENWPAYDKKLTPTNTMGAVAEMFRQWPGAVRTNHPARSVAALGPDAAFLAADHELSNIFGDNSPIDRLYQMNGKVLLLGVGYDKNTSLHLADFRAEYPGKHDVVEHSAIMENGRRVWKAYSTLFVDGEDFNRIGEAFENACSVSTGKIGDAVIRLMSQRKLVDFAVRWIEANRK